MLQIVPKRTRDVGGNGNGGSRTTATAAATAKAVSREREREGGVKHVGGSRSGQGGGKQVTTRGEGEQVTSRGGGARPGAGWGKQVTGEAGDGGERHVREGEAGHGSEAGEDKQVMAGAGHVPARGVRELGSGGRVARAARHGRGEGSRSRRGGPRHGQGVSAPERERERGVDGDYQRK
ncbi:hypothetical protein Scep_028189 [Stephania cephalantha]|uniref:Uncharacterized protein n=1 Tax=Stephania cephalantha TaxID=152367 RepID=A0AAP0ECN1_9MAGN